MKSKKTMPHPTAVPATIDWTGRFSERERREYLRLVALICDGARSLHATELAFTEAMPSLINTFLCGVNETRDREHLRPMFERLASVLAYLNDAKWTLYELIECHLDDREHDADTFLWMTNNGELPKIGKLIYGDWMQELLDASDRGTAEAPRVRVQRKGGAQ